MFFVCFLIISVILHHFKTKRKYGKCFKISKNPCWGCFPAPLAANRKRKEKLKIPEV